MRKIVRHIGALVALCCLVPSIALADATSTAADIQKQIDEHNSQISQLDAEIARGDWHVMKAEPRMIFERDPEKLWPELIRLSSAIQV